MEARILYPSGGRIGLLVPTGEMPAEEVARKDVPAGVPFLIVDAATLPELSLIDAWEADFSHPDGYGIGPEAWFAEQAARKEAEEVEQDKEGNQP